MPPVMGAAAFLMVEYLGLPYQTIIVAAIVPACMHFFGVFCQVHFEAKKLGMRGMTADELPKLREVMRRAWPTSVPLFVLLIVLFSGFTPYLAAFWGITACIVLGLTNRNPYIAVATLAVIVAAEATGQLTEWPAHLAILGAGIAVSAYYVLRDADGRVRLVDIADAFVMGAKYAISVGAAAATVGIIVGVVTLTGVGFKLSAIITNAAGDLAGLTGGVLPAMLFDAKGLTLFYTLVMTAIVCILLGCGVPTTPTYIIMVTVAAPALATMGVAPLVAHFFVFYYGVLADITPPVALAAYAGASMAGADPFKTGNTAFRLGLAKALVPFVFVYSPAMLLVTKGFTWAEFFETTGGCMVGIVMLAAALTGHGLAAMRAWERLLLGFASVLVISPSRTATLTGLVLGAPILVRQMLEHRSATPELGCTPLTSNRNVMPAQARGGRRAALLPPPVTKAGPSSRRGGRTVRPRFGPAIAVLSAHSTAGPSRWTHLVGVTCRARNRHPHLGTPSDLARRSAAALSAAMGELSPWRSVLPPLCSEGPAFAAGGGNSPAGRLPRGSPARGRDDLSEKWAAQPAEPVRGSACTLPVPGEMAARRRRARRRGRLLPAVSWRPRSGHRASR